MLQTSKTSIVLEMQRDLIQDTVKVSAVLRKARLTARKLALSEFTDWIATESDGYRGVIAAEMPRYRKVGLLPRVFNPYHGWQPVIIEDEQIHELLHTGYLYQSIHELEKLRESNESLSYSYPVEICNIIRSLIQPSVMSSLEIRGMMSTAQIASTINAVRNILLDWAVDLEKAGILGEGLGFSVDDQREAAIVTQNIYAQSIGNVGNVDGGASVQSTVSRSTFNVGSTGDYFSHIQAALPGIPDEQRASIQHEIDALQRSATPRDEKLVRRCLTSIQRICEGAAGSLAAKGVAAYITTLLT